MNGKRIARMAAGAAVAAGAAGIALSGVAYAASVNVTSLPDAVTIPVGGSVSVNVPNAKVCATGTTNFRAFVPGKQDAVTLATMPGAGCSAGQLNYTINDNANSSKRNAVVKFTATGANGKSTITQSLVIHIR